MKSRIVFMVFLIALGASSLCAEVVTSLPGKTPVIALTFDACETKTPSFFDQKIVIFLLAEQIPFTLFISGKFARRNEDELKALSRNPLIEVENHSLNHVQHMERLSDDDVIREVVECGQLLTEITGRKPIFFRFPAGNYDQRSLNIVEGLGYLAVHWSFASGDPDKRVSPSWLSTRVLSQAKQGSILIFHINGRGYSTGKALPKIVQQLKSRGYRFVLLRDLLTSDDGVMTKPSLRQISPPVSF
ncbi:MAG: polysaccharide deacetylase family protein [Desulfobulbus sp.]|nr:polysaccharide deacetylase family protein [Desulfobulbus sp.]